MGKYPITFDDVEGEHLPDGTVRVTKDETLYTLVTGTLTITPREVVVDGGIEAKSKVYDGWCPRRWKSWIKPS
ncbi:MAG: hypothetical protein Q4A07_01605 [Coriobacteriales bacterium]|nr:hypothetical protein [Coriobacteriales bacterium]